VIYSEPLAPGSKMLKGAALAMGVFDGVHEGHRFIVGEALNAARESHAKSIILTFDIDPDELFAHDRLKKIMTNEQRINKLAELDVDAVMVLPFNKEFAALPPIKFLDSLFLQYTPASINIGADFHFGARKRGNVTLLREWGLKHHMKVNSHDLLIDQGEPVTSTRIRHLLGEGRVELAAELLGHPYMLEGLVHPGRGEGRDFGFATANMTVAPQMRVLGEGVYACYALVDGERYKAAVSVGVSPLFKKETSSNTEVHLLDFEGNLYGKKIVVEFINWLRPMIAFESTEELIETVMSNIAWTRENL
jgi:riboflavin kinase/FMN adenylyltransferase